MIHEGMGLLVLAVYHLQRIYHKANPDTIKTSFSYLPWVLASAVHPTLHDDCIGSYTIDLKYFHISDSYNCFEVSTIGLKYFHILDIYNCFEVDHTEQ